jgi:hypothetical protein
MPRTVTRTLVAAAALAAIAACRSESPTSTSAERSLALASAFTSVPIGFGNTLNSFASGDEGEWSPRDHEGRGRGHDGGPGAGELMGGGLGPDFFGGIGFGRGFGHEGPFGRGGPGCTGTFDAATGRVTCTSIAHDGITVTRSIAYTDASGKAQSAFDTVTTNTVNERVSVSGTFTHRDGDSSVVTHASDRTVSGLAQGSTQRTVEGTSAGTEKITGSDSSGAFSVVRTAGDTTRGLVIPKRTSADSRPPYPTAGTVIRAMQITVTYAGKTPTTASRREVVTYDGSTTAKVTITKNGTTTSCTISLTDHRGRPSCQ